MKQPPKTHPHCLSRTMGQLTRRFTVLGNFGLAKRMAPWILHWYKLFICALLPSLDILLLYQSPIACLALYNIHRRGVLRWKAETKCISVTVLCGRSIYLLRQLQQETPAGSWSTLGLSLLPQLYIGAELHGEEGLSGHIPQLHHTSHALPVERQAQLLTSWLLSNPVHPATF